MKQNLFEILLAKMDKDFNKVDSGFKEVKTDIKEIKAILEKHDDLFVEYKWLSKPFFDYLNHPNSIQHF